MTAVSSALPAASWMSRGLPAAAKPSVTEPSSMSARSPPETVTSQALPPADTTPVTVPVVPLTLKSSVPTLPTGPSKVTRHTSSVALVTPPLLALRRTMDSTFGAVVSSVNVPLPPVALPAASVLVRVTVLPVPSAPRSSVPVWASLAVSTVHWPEPLARVV